MNAAALPVSVIFLQEDLNFLDLSHLLSVIAYENEILTMNVGASFPILFPGGLVAGLERFTLLSLNSQLDRKEKECLQHWRLAIKPTLQQSQAGIPLDVDYKDKIIAFIVRNRLNYESEVDWNKRRIPWYHVTFSYQGVYIYAEQYKGMAQEEGQEVPP